MKFLEGKKTLIGLILSGGAQIANEVVLLLDTDPATNPDWKIVVAAVVVIVGAVDRLRRGGSVAAEEAEAARVGSSSVKENR